MVQKSGNRSFTPTEMKNLAPDSLYFEAMPNSASALARFPTFLLDQAEDLGLDRKRLLAESRLTRQELEDPDSRIQARKSLRLWRSVFSAVDDPDLGIRLGAALTIRDVGLVGYTMMHSANLGEALKRLVRFGRILDETYPPNLQLVGERVEFCLEPLPEQRLSMHRLADFDVAALLAILRELTDLEILPVEVHLPYRQPAQDLAAHRAFLGGRLLFDQALIRVILTRQSLELPVRTADEALGRYLDQLAEQVLETLVPGGSLAEKVERALWAQIRDGRPQLENVAGALAMSPRTLQRRLREEETSFALLLDRFRHEMSLELLRDHELAIYEIAYLLGYSEPSTFYRAFRRWTHSSPLEYRASTEKT